MERSGTLFLFGRVPFVLKISKKQEDEKNEKTGVK